MGGSTMKKNTTVEELCRLAWENGAAKKGMYSVNREEETVTLTLRNNALAAFRVTGYQTGVVEHSETKTAAQESAVNTFINYFTGELA
jgi:hypothetical protein